MTARFWTACLLLLVPLGCGDAQPQPPPGRADALVIEFAPVSPDAIAVGRLVRSTADIADRAGVAPCMLRLGRLVPSHHGRVVLDNELVLGFAQRVGHDEAARQLGRAGGRLLQDLSDPSGTGLIYVVRFEENDPEAALALALARPTSSFMRPRV